MKAQPAGGVAERETEAEIALKVDLLSKFIIDPETGCWRWKYKPNKGGYGRLRVCSKRTNTSFAAHRLAYLKWVGPIADGLVVDHKCRNRSCINPEHLEVVTHKENIRRSNLTRQRARHEGWKTHNDSRLRMSGTGHRKEGEGAKRTHCRRGHPFVGANVMPRANGNRRCRKCHNAQKRRNWPNYVRRRKLLSAKNPIAGEAK
jgi:hypothetical protein